MNDTDIVTAEGIDHPDAAAGTPWHLWAVGIVSLIWNAFGATDYVMTNLRNEEWLAQAGEPAEILAWIESFPAWAHALWAIGVWLSVAGSLLLLARSRYAVPAFALSLVGAIGSFAYQFSIPMPPSLDSGMGYAMPFVIIAVVALQLFYAVRMRQRRVLR